MTRRVIALFVLAAVVGVPFLAGCENKDKDTKTTKMKIDTEGSQKEMSIKHD